MAIADLKSVDAKLPSGPRGTWGPTLQIIRRPRQAFESWAAKYGDPFLVHALNGAVVVTGRPDLIKEIFARDPDTYAQFATGTIIPLLGRGSIFAMQGAEHKRERRLIMPMFHGDRMKSYAASMQQVAIEEMQTHSGQSSFQCLDMMTNISMEIIVRSIFGGHDQSRIERLFTAGREVVHASSPMLFFTTKSHFRFLRMTPYDRFMKARAKLEAAFDDELHERQRKEFSGDDILSLLASAKYEDGSAITREHIHSELQTFLFAGHETSALGMTWAMYHLHRNPETLARLRQELDGVDENDVATLAQVPYLKAVVQESLRLNPIVVEVLRTLLEPMQLGDYVIPAGYSVAAAAGLAHYNPDIYPDPEAFKPERFIERTFSPFEYMPFGGGHRRCIGAAFASYEMAIVIGTLIKRFNFELLETKPVVAARRNVTLGPSTGVAMRCTSNR